MTARPSLDRIARVLGVLVVMAAALLGLTGVASAAPAKVKIQPLHVSGKCLDIQDASTLNSARLIQFDCKGTANQKFRLKEISSHVFEIRADHSGKCLDVQGAGAGAAQIIQFTCTGKKNQQFVIDSGANGVSTIRPRHVDNMCLDVQGASTQNSANLLQFGCKGGSNNQLFTFLPVL
jgi:coenzyme F420-reducing hydrogenase delta subunit